MSDTNLPAVTQDTEVQVIPKIDEHEKKSAMEGTIFSIVGEGSASKDSESFYGHVLQCMSIGYSEQVPTAGVFFDKKAKNFRMMVNPFFFTRILDHKERKAVLIHELMHITHKHVFFNNYEMKDAKRLNYAMDLVINQFIKNLPKMCLKIENFRDKDLKLFPANMPVETYYKLLEQDAEMKMPDMGEGDESEGDGDKESKKGKGKGKPGDKQGSGQGDKWEKVDFSKEFDEHGWGEGDGDESALKDKLESMKDLFKRAMQKSSFSHDNLPGSIKDLLQELDAKIGQLNYKQLLLGALKRSIPAKDIDKTWKRPSRRLGRIAPGHRLGDMPRIQVFLDTSGSISTEELNEFLAITNNFLINGVKSCTLNFFHTEVYHSEKVKANHVIKDNNLKSKVNAGGTHLKGVLEKIIKTKADLNIVVTDGYYEDIPEVKRLPETVFVISKNGTKEHPLKRLGKTLKYA